MLKGVQNYDFFAEFTPDAYIKNLQICWTDLQVTLGLNIQNLLFNWHQRFYLNRKYDD